VPSEGHHKDTQKTEKRRVKKRMKAKMTMVASVLLISLMLVGVSYAMWKKTLVIYGSANTGTLDATLAFWKWNDSYTDYQGVQHSVVPSDKRTWDVEPWLIDPEDMEIQVDYLYPCIWIHVWFNITNTGSIPWIVQNFTVHPYGFPGDLLPSPANLVGTQLEQNEHVTCDLEIHLNNTATPDTWWYYFLVQIRVVQYNEYQGPPAVHEPSP
jgi:hypothetical protein